MLAGVAFACGDLFHATSFDTACSDDAAPCLPPPVATSACQVDHAAAVEAAKRSCALLAACEAPIGDNQTGRCYANAIAAFDCTANPDRKLKHASADAGDGTARDQVSFWACMAGAGSCDAVRKCASPDGPANCTIDDGGGTFLGCAASGNLNVDSRIQCLTNNALGPMENCAAYGQSCASIGKNSSALCVGPQKRACTKTGCTGAALSVCDDAGVDHGVDCAQVGAGTCVEQGAYAAGCKPDTATTGAASGDVTCDTNQVATSYLTGYRETFDCTKLNGVCTPIHEAGAGTTPEKACFVPDGGCATDTCNDGGDPSVLHACVQGVVVDITCTAYADAGLGNCAHTVQTSEGPRAACSVRGK